MVEGAVITLNDVDWPTFPSVNRVLEERGPLAHIERAPPQQGRLVKKAMASVVSFTMKVKGASVQVVHQPAPDE